MAGSTTLKFAITAVSLGLMSAVATAAPTKKTPKTPMNYRYSMNAMCMLKSANGAKPEPVNITEKEIKDSDSTYLKKVPATVEQKDIDTKFRIASLSKILLSHWAIYELGPLYRFETKVHVTPSAKDAKGCNIYFEGSQDPFMGKEMLGTVFQQLRETFKNKKICSRIDSISYDENFLVPFNASTRRFVLQHRQDGDLRASNPLSFYGPNTTRKALQYFFKTQRILPVKQDAIGLTSSALEYQEYLKANPHLSYSFKSQPLHMMLREINAFSFNVPPDIIYKKLGGPEAYAKFIKNRLGYGPDHVDVVNGSGYPVISDGKRYNEVSCSAFVRVVQDLAGLLAHSRSARVFQLADIMAVGGEDEEFSTFKSLYGSAQYTNTLVAKTGSAEEAITFGGMLSTTEGDLYFAVLTRPDSYVNSVTNGARTYVRDMMTVLAERHTLKPFDYKQTGLMKAIDSEAQLKEIEVDYVAFGSAPAATGKKTTAETKGPTLKASTTLGKNALP